MANERNVDALTALLSDYVMSLDGHGTDLDNIHLAAWLAARGVLVPSALDWEGALTAVKAVGRFDIAHDGAGFTARLAHVLERIAKGEP